MNVTNELFLSGQSPSVKDQIEKSRRDQWRRGLVNVEHMAKETWKK